MNNLDNWNTASLGEVVCNNNSKRIPLKEADRRERKGEYPYYGASGIIDYIDEYLFDGQYLLVGEDGANLLARSTPIAFIAHGKFWVNNHAHVLGATEYTDLKYLEYFFKTLDLKPYVTGSAQPKLNRKNLDRIPIPLPPLKEQKRIAAILDKADAIRQKRKEVIALTEELLRSTFLDMFGDPVTNPKGWSIQQLGDLTNKIGSGATPKGGKSSYKSEGITLIRSMNVYDYLFEYEGLAFIDDKQAQALNNVSVMDDDILLNITGASVARCTIVPPSLIPARVNQHVAIIRTKSDLLDPCYLLSLINSASFKKKLLGIANNGGATREALTKEDLQQLPIPLPKIGFQRKFSTIYKNISAVKDNTNHLIEELDNLFNSLLQKAFRGEL